MRALLLFLVTGLGVLLLIHRHQRCILTTYVCPQCMGRVAPEIIRVDLSVPDGGSWVAECPNCSYTVDATHTTPWLVPRTLRKDT